MGFDEQAARQAVTSQPVRRARESARGSAAQRQSALIQAALDELHRLWAAWERRELSNRDTCDQMVAQLGRRAAVLHAALQVALHAADMSDPATPEP